ncbi:immunoglobulin lambda-1 light chain-like [Nycticebus coucang]|uniref:immunoglobulin lambda-1 light chain-like n=1 Tax=Nycticebus coucang TaxID=9470 RepID=UPI00234CB816|nr:immunoglobulin lambda-1 light chain-like [Nycticebus coucang]
MQRIFSFIHLSLFCAGVMPAVVLVPGNQKVTVSVGESTTLRCSMQGGTIGDYYLNWYRKTQDGALTFIYRESNTYGPGFTDGFTGAVDNQNNQVVLIISKVSERDEGLYYCACDYWGGALTAQLFFGNSTQLIVEPKYQAPTKPSVFVMKNGTNVACLVKDFYPKNVNITLKSSKKIKEFDPAIVISPSKKYSAVKLGQYEDPNSVTCSVEHNRETVHSTDFELKTKSSDNQKPTEPGKTEPPTADPQNADPQKTEQTSESCHKPKATVRAEKVNMLSLTVLGLRMLFAKSVAVNFLLTAKLFLL